MSKQPSEKSPAGSDHQVSGSVYDFLYHDARRVGSFLAQLVPDGHLQSRKLSKGATRLTGGTDKLAGSGGLPGIAKATGESSDTWSAQHAQTADETYDPLWANALALLDYLTERELINRNIHTAAVGEIVLLTGSLKLLNLRVLESVLNHPSAPDHFNLNRPDIAAEMRNQNALGLQVVRASPQGIQAHFTGHGDNASVSWMTLDEASLVVPASTITMQFGSWMDGRWSCLAIKDAVPDRGAEIDTELQQMVSESWEFAAAARHSTPLAIVAELLGPAIRQMMGRPAFYFGVTPVLIFREINGGTEA